MNYRVIDKETYYRSGVFRRFSEDCKCSAPITSRVDVTELKEIDNFISRQKAKNACCYIQ